MGIAGDDRQSLHLRLRDDEPVKGVAMMPGQSNQCVVVVERRWKHGKSVGIQYAGKNHRKTGLEVCGSAAPTSSPPGLTCTLSLCLISRSAVWATRVPCRSGGRPPAIAARALALQPADSEAVRIRLFSGRSRPEPLAHSSRRRVGAGDGSSGAGIAGGQRSRWRGRASTSRISTVIRASSTLTWSRPAPTGRHPQGMVAFRLKDLGLLVGLG